MAEVNHPDRLNFLAELRSGKDPRYTHRDMARHFDLNKPYSYQTVGQWERGQVIPPENHRERFIEYLWRILGLRRQPDDFEEKWQVLVEAWGWAPLDREERRRLKLAPIAAPNGAGNTSPFQSVAPMQAPAYPAHFVGRFDEMAECRALLASAKTDHDTAAAAPMILALVGMGGMGKTTLATYIAHQLHDEFRDGILWGRVATDNPLDILQSWAQAYGYDFSTISSTESRAAAVRNIMADKQALIILDDVTVLQKGQLLLPAAADCVVLLTTRSLDIATALNAQRMLLGELTAEQSVELLVATIGLDRVQAEIDAAQSIGKTLQYLPLAVELVAQRLAARPRQSLAATVDLLQRASYRLDLGISDRAIRASFLVSWEALTAEQQRLFALMGVFAGRTFAVDALARVAELDRVITEDILMDLAALSLVKEEGLCYRQHPLLADFAREQLAEESNAYLRMAGYFWDFADENQMNYPVLDLEWDNLMYGMETAHRLERWQLVLDYAETLTEPWFTRAEYTRARQGYAWAVEATQMLEQSEAETRLLCDWGSVCLEQGDHDEANTIIERCLHSAYQLEVGDIIADAQFAQARISIERSDYQKAEQLLIDCKDIRTMIGDVVGVSAVTYWQGFLAYRHGDYKTARNLCLDASYSQKQEQDDLGLLRTLRLFTDIAFASDDFENALHYGQQAVVLAQQLHDRGEYAAALYNLAKVYRRTGNLEQAEKCAEDSLALFQQMGSKMFHAFTLFELSKIKEEGGKKNAALDCIQRSIAAIRKLQDRFNLVIALRYLGDLQKQDDIAAAMQTWHDALLLAKEQNHPDIAKLEERLHTSSLHCESIR